MHYSRQPIARLTWHLSGGGSILLLSLIMAGVILIWRPLPNTAIAVGSTNLHPALEGFWQAKQNGNDTFRWISGEAIIWMREYATAAGVIAELHITSPFATAEQPIPLTLRSDEDAIGALPITPTWRVYRVLAAPQGGLWRTANIDLHSPTNASGSADDLRRLGVVVSHATLRPATPLLPLAFADLLARISGSALIVGLLISRFGWWRNRSLALILLISRFLAEERACGDFSWRACGPPNHSLCTRCKQNSYQSGAAFIEFDTWLKQHYQRAIQGDGYTIYQLKRQADLVIGIQTDRPVSNAHWPVSFMTR